MIKNATRFLPLGAVGATMVSMSWATPTYALTVFGTPLNPFNITNASVINDQNSPPQQKAVGFTTDNQEWTLNSVTLSLLSYDTADIPFGVFEIRSNNPINGGQPGATHTILGNSNPTPTFGAPGNFTFTPTGGNTTLAPNTTYWLVATGTSYSWTQNIDANPTASNGSGWTFLDYKFTGNGSPDWGIGNSVKNAFTIDATEITPVPFAFSPIPGLIVSGIIGGVKRARSKSRQAKGTAEA
ncbi:hypothetical protein H6F89_15855 [Cyanobacteria bacterium FACHB-63]|nr:hypothetical protein [Cyanobacteria bacterium FACHB-63]